MINHFKLKTLNFRLFGFVFLIAAAYTVSSHAVPVSLQHLGELSYRVSYVVMPSPASLQAVRSVFEGRHRFRCDNLKVDVEYQNVGSSYRLRDEVSTRNLSGESISLSRVFQDSRQGFFTPRTLDYKKKTNPDARSAKLNLVSSCERIDEIPNDCKTKRDVKDSEGKKIGEECVPGVDREVREASWGWQCLGQEPLLGERGELQKAEAVCAPFATGYGIGTRDSQVVSSALQAGIQAHWEVTDFSLPVVANNCTSELQQSGSSQMENRYLVNFRGGLASSLMERGFYFDFKTRDHEVRVLSNNGSLDVNFLVCLNSGAREFEIEVGMFKRGLFGVLPDEPYRLRPSSFWSLSRGETHFRGSFSLFEMLEQATEKGRIQGMRIHRNALFPHIIQPLQGNIQMTPYLADLPLSFIELRGAEVSRERNSF